MFREEEKKAVLEYARGVLKSYLENKPEPKLFLKAGWLSEKRGVFVTLKQNGKLRGCIGLILGLKPLFESLREMTLAAAFEDPRFPPLAPYELGSVKIHISILTAPALAGSWRDIRPGTDGIIVSLGRKKGVYLPEVATETGWDPRTFFMSCATEKAGLSEAEAENARLEVFQTEGFEEEGYS
ncbi:MAG TPA: AmmeMemoRadiSam system protein A [Candidatus Omnitrophota bacterium]|nr:AmmeMemoRadiSam system protein A [Candidatus Omnitrophota bacterium]HPS36913.1 AmmeMemoRadiSam system protein A [Candidatus Omnitrophota bacterium]